VARIREAEIGDDGEIRIIRSKFAEGWRALIGLTLIVGGVWLFDTTYGGRSQAAAAYEQSETVSN
jgi:hypothetical protein